MLRILEESYTFDDVLLVPAYSDIMPQHVHVNTHLNKKLLLNMPIMSAAMDTITDYKMAIAMAKEGGIGIIHKNMSAIEQAKSVALVKRYESVIVENPITANPHNTLAELLVLMQQHNISGIPITENDILIGLITNRDIKFETNLNLTIDNIMTPKHKLITLSENANLDEARLLMKKHRIERVLLINEQHQLKGIITAKDLNKININPQASKDQNGQLLVGAAVGVADDAKSRLPLLYEAGVDVIVIDTAHGHSKGVIDTVKWVKEQYPHIIIIAGNIATASAAIALKDAGVDAVKVGIGPGSICTTRIIAGVGVPQLSAIANIKKALADTDIGIIADGGIRYSGDIAKALAAGANLVMLGNMLAGTDATPGETHLFQGRLYKSYRGMGSIGAMKLGSADRYSQDKNSTQDKLVPEGIEGRVPYKGELAKVLYQLIGGVKSSMGYTGCKTIPELHHKASFVKITAAGMKESHVHDVNITKEAPNYNINL